MGESANEPEQAVKTAPLVVVLARDLMVGVRVESAAQGLGCQASTAADLEALAALPLQTRLGAVVLDLSDPAFPLEVTLAALDRFASRPPVLAFHPHVMRELGESARRAGCTMVVARSRFMAELPALLQQTLHG